MQYALASVLLGPEDQVVPLGAANVTFTCRTAGELRWKVLLFVVSPAIEGDVDLLRRQGICMQDLLINNSTSPQQYTSTLVVKQPEDYNGSVITCGNPDPNSRARQSIINGQQAIVLVFGKSMYELYRISTKFLHRSSCVSPLSAECSSGPPQPHTAVERSLCPIQHQPAV